MDFIGRVSLTCNPQFPGKRRVERHRVGILTLSARAYVECNIQVTMLKVESVEMK